MAGLASLAREIGQFLVCPSKVGTHAVSVLAPDLDNVQQRARAFPSFFRQIAGDIPYFPLTPRLARYVKTPNPD